MQEHEAMQNTSNFRCSAHIKLIKLINLFKDYFSHFILKGLFAVSLVSFVKSFALLSQSLIKRIFFFFNFSNNIYRAERCPKNETARMKRVMPCMDFFLILRSSVTAFID